LERRFDIELAALKEKILLMGAHTENIVRKALTAILGRDSDLANEVVQDDAVIDRLEVEIEEGCVNLFALRQPVATDLRLITAALKISNDLERIGDHGVNIAGNALRLAAQPRFRHPAEIERLGEMAIQMLGDALDAFTRRDGSAARALVRRDDDVDSLNRRIFVDLMTSMRDDPESITPLLEWIMVARNLERVADLATNIAEEVVFIAEAEIIKHHQEERPER
jgi:phosphate transport system protein